MSAIQAKRNAKGLPIVPLPTEAGSWSFQIMRFVMTNIVFNVLVPPFVLSFIWRGKIKLAEIKEIYNTIRQADRNPINQRPEYQDPQLLEQLWSSDSAQPYLSHDALEYQTREGFCNSTTVRCTLKSFARFPRDKLPPQKSEPSDPDKWKGMDAWKIHDDDDDDASNPTLEVFRGDRSYEEFLHAIKRGLNAPDTRVVLNYLRPVLFGFNRPRWLPANLFLSLVGGHFSPIVGMVETDQNKEDDNPLIGVFDVNHKYGGAYLVPARDLYDSVRLLDLTTQKPRAIILVHEPKTVSRTKQSDQSPLPVKC